MSNHGHYETVRAICSSSLPCRWCIGTEGAVLLWRISLNDDVSKGGVCTSKSATFHTPPLPSPSLPGPSGGPPSRAPKCQGTLNVLGALQLGVRWCGISWCIRCLMIQLDAVVFVVMLVVVVVVVVAPCTYSLRQREAGACPGGVERCVGTRSSMFTDGLVLYMCMCFVG